MAKKRPFACDRCDRRYKSEDGVSLHKIRLSHDCTCNACHDPQTYSSFAMWLVHIETGNCPILGDVNELIYDIFRTYDEWATCWVHTTGPPGHNRSRIACFYCSTCKARYTKLSKLYQHVEEAQHCHRLLAPSHDLGVLKDKITYYCHLKRILYFLRRLDLFGICSVTGLTGDMRAIWTEVNCPPSFAFGSDENIYRLLASRHHFLAFLRSWWERTPDAARRSASGTAPRSSPGRGPAQPSQGIQHNDVNVVTKGCSKTQQEKSKKNQEKKSTKSADQVVDSGQAANARRNTLNPSHVRDSPAMSHSSSTNLSMIAWHSSSGSSQDEGHNSQELALPGVNANNPQRVHETHKVNAESNIVPRNSGRYQIQQPNTRTQQVNKHKTKQASTTLRATSAQTTVPNGRGQGHIEPPSTSEPVEPILHRYPVPRSARPPNVRSRSVPPPELGPWPSSPLSSLEMSMKSKRSESTGRLCRTPSVWATRREHPAALERHPFGPEQRSANESEETPDLEATDSQPRERGGEALVVPQRTSPPESHDFGPVTPRYSPPRGHGNNFQYAQPLARYVYIVPAFTYVSPQYAVMYPHPPFEIQHHNGQGYVNVPVYNQNFMGSPVAPAAGHRRPRSRKNRRRGRGRKRKRST